MECKRKLLGVNDYSWGNSEKKTRYLKIHNRSSIYLYLKSSFSLIFILFNLLSTFATGYIIQKLLSLKNKATKRPSMVNLRFPLSFIFTTRSRGMAMNVTNHIRAFRLVDKLVDTADGAVVRYV